MSSVNNPNPQVDTTVKIFDNFYRYATEVPVEEYDIVYSYFKSVFGTAEAAANFTVTLFRISNESNIPVMTLLQQMQGQSSPDVTLTIAYYLNSLQSQTTLLGVNAVAAPNYYVARNCLA